MKTATIERSVNTGKPVAAPAFVWDEPAGCTTPRGWCRFTKRTHPDRKARGFDYFADDIGGLGCGNYLTYKETTGPEGETVHWVCYVKRVNEVTGCHTETRLGFGWVRTIEEAREMIEGNVRAYLGLPRKVA